MAEANNVSCRDVAAFDGTDALSRDDNDVADRSKLPVICVWCEGDTVLRMILV